MDPEGVHSTKLPRVIDTRGVPTKDHLKEAPEVNGSEYNSVEAPHMALYKGATCVSYP